MLSMQPILPARRTPLVSTNKIALLHKWILMFCPFLLWQTRSDCLEVFHLIRISNNAIMSMPAKASSASNWNFIIVCLKPASHKMHCINLHRSTAALRPEDLPFFFSRFNADAVISSSLDFLSFLVSIEEGSKISCFKPFALIFIIDPVPFLAALRVIGAMWGR